MNAFVKFLIEYGSETPQDLEQYMLMLCEDYVKTLNINVETKLEAEKVSSEEKGKRLIF
jgi:hypothetical protein